MEQAIISGITYAIDDLKVTIHELPDKVGVAAKVFATLAESNINVDVIIQNVSAHGAADISFTVAESDRSKAESVLDALKEELGFSSYDVDPDIAKVTLVGAGMRTYPGIAAKMFQVLAEEKINIEMISTSSIKISCVIRQKDAQKAVKAIHKAFKLDDVTATREEILG